MLDATNPRRAATTVESRPSDNGIDAVAMS
jgi:hypothetical protein